jgi:7-cyano-7-deazaguanine synthase
VAEYSNGEVQFDAPFISIVKPGIIEFGRTHSLPFHLTYSCEGGTAPPCGVCPSCRDRAALAI